MTSAFGSALGSIGGAVFGAGLGGLGGAAAGGAAASAPQAMNPFSQMAPPNSTAGLMQQWQNPIGYMANYGGR